MERTMDVVNRFHEVTSTFRIDERRGLMTKDVTFVGPRFS